MVSGVYAVGATIYAATNGGVSISNNGGGVWITLSTVNCLWSNNVKSVYASDDRTYAATSGGLSVASDGESSFTNDTTVNGLGSNDVRGVCAVGDTVYAATFSGLSVATVPEPSTCVMALAGLACGGWQMWRRRSQPIERRSRELDSHPTTD